MSTHCPQQNPAGDLISRWDDFAGCLITVVLPDDAGLSGCIQQSFWRYGEITSQDRICVSGRKARELARVLVARADADEARIRAELGLAAS